MRIAKPELGIDIGGNSQSGEIDCIYTAIEVLHSASEYKTEQVVRQRHAGINTLHHIEVKISVFFHTETETEQFGAYITIYERNFPKGVEQGLLIAVGMYSGNGFAC